MRIWGGGLKGDPAKELLDVCGKGSVILWT